MLLERSQILGRIRHSLNAPGGRLEDQDYAVSHLKTLKCEIGIEAQTPLEFVAVGSRSERSLVTP
jgi:hypothetical protein